MSIYTFLVTDDNFQSNNLDIEDIGLYAVFINNALATFRETELEAYELINSLK